MDTSWRDASLAVCRLLGDAINGRISGTTRFPNEDFLLEFCKAHRIATLVSSALRTNGIPEDPYRTLHSLADTAAFHQIKNDLITSAALEQLTKSGVTAFPLKGAALQAVYPDGWIRTTTDADFYIPVHQLGTATAVLNDMEFIQSCAQDGDVVFQKPPRTVIELHTTLGGFSAQQQQSLKQICQHPFSVNEHYVYTLFHLYKHFLYAGAGVRMFWDIYCLSRAVTDRDCINEWLNKLALRGFDSAVQEVTRILFDSAPCSDDMAQIIDLVLTSGAFGTGNTYHAMKRAAQPITQKRRFRAWLSDYGFDRTAMTVRYPVLIRHGWLYPLCAVHRVLNGLLFRHTVLKKAVSAEHAVDPRQMGRILRTMQIL